MVMEKNIALAIQKEEEYIYDKVNNNDVELNIYDYLAEAGYTDLEEYRRDAKDYWVKSQNYEVVEEPVINVDVPVPYLTNQTPAFLYTINCTYNYAFIPTSYNNYDLIEQYGYTPVKLGYENSNGPILSSNGDLRIYLILKKNEHIEITYHYFLIKLKEYFDRYFDNVEISNNDILINGEKVLGGAMIEYNGLLIVVFQINFVDKREDIISICGITPKIPGCVDSSVVTAEQIKNEFLLWLTL
jgi:hypothetical protein